MVHSKDTSPRAELHDTGLSPVEIIARHSRLGSHNDPSSYHSSTSQTDHASTVSQSSGVPIAVSRHELPSPPTETASPSGGSRPDSPPLGRDGDAVGQPVGAQTGGGNGGIQLRSGVSEVSDADRAHLRQVSDATVSSVGTRGGGDRVLPEGGGGQGGASSLRRSVFRESDEDMGVGR